MEPYLMIFKNFLRKIKTTNVEEIKKNNKQKGKSSSAF